MDQETIAVERGRARTAGRLLAEFTIIVVGVLVALAVDEWRDGRADTRLERFFYEALAEDLRADSVDFVRFERIHARRASAGTVALRAAGHASVDTVAITDSVAAELSPAGALSLIGRANFLEPSRAAYQTMISTGGIAIISDPELRRRILDYYIAVDKNLDINPYLGQRLDAFVRRLQSFGSTPEDGEAIDARRPLADPEMLALIRELRRQAQLASLYGGQLAPLATELRREILDRLKP